MLDFRFEKSFAGPGADQALAYDPAAGCGFVTEDARAGDPALQPPELNSGFLPAWWYGGERLSALQATAAGVSALPTAAVRAEDMKDRRLPLWYKVSVPARGQYQVTVTVQAGDTAEPETLLFLGRRRLAWRGALQAGQRREITGVTDVSPIVARGQTTKSEDTSVDIALVGRGVSLCSVAVMPAACKVIYIMGDSTVTDQSADLPYAPGTSYSGWGQMLGAYLPGGYCVSNHAHSGLTTESFRSEGHYAIMRPLLKAGDICLLQFGHNDQKLAALTAYGGYTERLKLYIEELRTAGATPVLVTPLARNSWRADGSYNDLLADYAAACRSIGAATDTPVADLHRRSVNDITGVGLERAKAWFYPSDYTHTNDFGAYHMAAQVYAELCRLGVLPATGAQAPAWPVQPPLSPLQPPEHCAVQAPADAADPFADFEQDAPLDRVGLLDLVIRAMHFFPINVYNDLYADVIGHETFAGTVQCAAQNGLIPPVFVRDGSLHPTRPVTLEETLAVLMPAYASRRKLQSTARTPADVAPFAEEAARLAVGEGLVKPTADWAATITRRQGAALCRKVKI